MTVIFAQNLHFKCLMKVPFVKQIFRNLLLLVSKIWLTAQEKSLKSGEGQVKYLRKWENATFLCFQALFPSNQSSDILQNHHHHHHHHH